MVRFAELSENDLTCLLNEKGSKNTKKATKVALKLFREYINERKFEEDEPISSQVKLAAVLRKFYAEARKKNGDLKSKASLVRIRFGRQRFFSSHEMDIIKDHCLSSRNYTAQARRKSTNSPQTTK